MQDWLDNSQPRGILCGPMSSRVCKPHLMTLPVLRGCGCWGLTRGVWHHQDRRRRGPREFTGIVDHSRGGSSHGPLVGPGPGKVWHRVQELVGRARRRLPCRGANRDSGSLPGTARTPSLGLLPGRHQRPRCLSRLFIIGGVVGV